MLNGNADVIVSVKANGKHSVKRNSTDTHVCMHSTAQPHTHAHTAQHRHTRTHTQHSTDTHARTHSTAQPHTHAHTAQHRHTSDFGVVSQSPALRTRQSHHSGAPQQPPESGVVVVLRQVRRALRQRTPTADHAERTTRTTPTNNQFCERRLHSSGERKNKCEFKRGGVWGNERTTSEERWRVRE